MESLVFIVDVKAHLEVCDVAKCSLKDPAHLKNKYFFLECFHFLDVFRRRIFMRATYICLDVVETVHQTVHYTVGSFLQLQNKNEKSGGVRVGCPLICPKLCRIGCLS